MTKRKRNVHILYSDSSFHKGAAHLEGTSLKPITTCSSTEVTYYNVNKNYYKKKAGISLFRVQLQPNMSGIPESTESRPLRVNNESPVEP